LFGLANPVTICVYDIGRRTTDGVELNAYNAAMNGSFKCQRRLVWKVTRKIMLV